MNDLSPPAWLQLLTSAGFAGLVWYWIIWAWPKARADFREETLLNRMECARLREEFGKALAELNRERSAERAALLEAIGKTRRPDPGPLTEERR